MTAHQPIGETHPGGLDRNKDLKIIHIAKKDLDMAEESYRAIVRTISNQRTDSSAKLTGAERAKLIAHLKACGFSVKQTKPAHVFPESPLWNKVWSNWQKLASAGKVRDRRAAGLAAWVKNQTSVEAMAWVTDSQLHKLIDQLNQWLDRK